jgi:membrane protein DedA with SNARE-associated domain
VTAYTGYWKLLYDWQTLVAGVLAIFAAIIGGGAAYWAGRIQAKATRKAADRQEAAVKEQLAYARRKGKQPINSQTANGYTERYLKSILLSLAWDTT